MKELLTYIIGYGVIYGVIFTVFLQGMKINNLKNQLEAEKYYRERDKEWAEFHERMSINLAIVNRDCDEYVENCEEFIEKQEKI